MAMEIYIFGAGASAAEGAPATQDFFARAWDLLGPEFDEATQAVWRFLETIFRVPVRDAGAFQHMPAVDEVISLVDWSLHANQGLGFQYDPPRLFLVRRDLEHLLCTTLQAALFRHEQADEGPHSRFARALSRGPGREYALISLNYDTLLDEALAAGDLAPDYGLGVGTEQGPLLAKLHGSLNWAHCPACSEIQVTGAPARAACRRCGNPSLHGLIISPTWLKRYWGAHLQLLWDRALAAVQRAERIVFVGYSMPPADVAVHHLIQRGLLARSDLRTRPAIHVINHTSPKRPAAETELHQSALMNRFTRLFGPEVTFDFAGFHGQV